MTTTAGVSSDATVLPLRRPPIRQSIVVASDRQHTFEVFVATIGAWWPVEPFSAGGDRVREVTFEQELGGRVYETWDDGSTVDWGTVLTWDPPHRFAMSWLVTGTATEVDDADDADRVRGADPAVTSGLLTAEVHPMVSAFVRPFAAV